MCISSDWEIKRIKEYAILLKKEHDLQIEISCVQDEIINLCLTMSMDDIRQAEQLFLKSTSDQGGNL